MRPPPLDPFGYEVLRHRLSAITVEGAVALQRVSGSPLATEAFDLNTSIMSAGGEVAFAGPYLLTGPMGQGMIVRAILSDERLGPAIAPGDMFLCNDPYVGAAHQNCVTLVAPIHAADRLVGWCGATLHVVDVGGPQAGQVGIGARSILEEAPPIPPVRIVAAGRILPDVEAEYLGRSRTPELNGLDLRAKIAALSTIRDRVLALGERHGADVVGGVIDRTIERGTAHFRRRLGELPDGSATHSAFLDQVEDGRLVLYEVRLRIDKRDDRLVLDFRGSSPQAGAVINCTRSGLASGVLVGALATLVWDAPWCPAAIERSIDIISEPGTVVDARWPAGCSMSTMAAGFAATTATAVGLSRLLAASDRHRDRAMAAWAGAVGSVDLFGSDAMGRPFGTVLLDSMATGTGARARADGIDSGGFLRSIACVVANVEQYEARFPLLYLWRRQEPDTGGAGRRRGGAGVGFAVIPHGVDRIAAVIPHFSGTAQPESVGQRGGYPGAPNRALVVEGSSVRTTLAGGSIPADFAALGGRITSLPGVARLPLERDDALVVVSTGGGGWGDPLEREPGLVADDVRSLLVSRAEAGSTYGVAIDGAGDPDPTATEARRLDIRRRRAAAAGHPPPFGEGILTPAADPPEDGLRLEDAASVSVLMCPRCGHLLPPGAPGPPLATAASATRRLDAVGWHAVPGAWDADPPFALVEHYCPRCLRLVATDRARLAPMEEERVQDRAAARRHPE